MMAMRAVMGMASTGAGPACREHEFCACRSRQAGHTNPTTAQKPKNKKHNFVHNLHTKKRDNKEDNKRTDRGYNRENKRTTERTSRG